MRLFLILGLAAWAGAPIAAGESVEVPFELASHQILFEVRVGGEGPFRMVLDTAVHPSVVDVSVAPPQGNSAGYAAGFGSEDIPYWRHTLEELSVGNLSIVDLETVIMDTSHLKIDGVPIHGVLAESFFRRIWVEVDYPRRRLRFQPHDQRRGAMLRSCGDGLRELDADLSGKLPRLRGVRVNGQPFTALLDTGASAGIHLPLSEARRLRLLDGSQPVERVEGIGARGRFEAWKTWVESVQIGDHTVYGVETIVSDSATQVAVGNGFLQKFVLTVDFGASRICLGQKGGDGSAHIGH